MASACFLGSAGRERAGEAGEQVFLVVWLCAALAVAVVLLPFGTARYMLPTLPPLWLLLVRRFEAIPRVPRWLSLATAAVVAQGLLLGAMLGVADAEYAGRYREVAWIVRHDHPSQRIWFVGEWGFRYYMGELGGLYLRSSDEAPQKGDIIIRPSIAGMHEMSAAVRRRAVLTQEIDLGSRWPIRLMSFKANAGYYSVHWGFLPWALSKAPLERIEIFEMRDSAPRGEPTTCESS